MAILHWRYVIIYLLLTYYQENRKYASFCDISAFAQSSYFVLKMGHEIYFLTHFFEITSKYILSTGLYLHHGSPRYVTGINI